jgi:hypothetical protein
VDYSNHSKMDLVVDPISAYGSAHTVLTARLENTMNSQIAYRASTIRIDEMLSIADERRRARPAAPHADGRPTHGLVGRLRRPALRPRPAR